MKREKLGELFLKAGLISEQVLAHVLQENRLRPEEKLGQTLMRLKLASDADIARALSLQSNIPYIDLNAIIVDPYAVKQVPLDVARQYHILPVYIEKNNLVLAMETPQDFEAIEAARFASGLNIRPHVSTHSEIMAGIKRYYSVEESLNAALRNVKPDDDVELLLQQVKPTDEQLDDLKKQSESPAIMKMVNTLIFQGIAIRASEIQIDPQKDDVAVRNRVDGVLTDSMRLPRWACGGLVSRVKIMAGMDFTRRHIPQKGRASFKMQQRVIEMEISSLPSQFGESLIIQILDTGETIPLMKDLGLVSDDLTKLNKLLFLPQGLTLICGPASSGKTTTLYALCSELSRNQRKIITIEDAIEYQLKGARQVQIKEQAGLTFSQAFQSIIRQNPEVIALGEIRDKNTAEMAMEASQKGHRVIGVVRADDMMTTILQLKQLGVNPQLFAAAMSGIVTQRLVRKICSHCREQYAPASQLIHAIETRFGEKVTGPFLHGKGCQKCNYTGYQDRIGVYYVVIMSQALRRVILQPTPTNDVGSSITKIETSLLMKDILAKVKQGLTTLEELERVILGPPEAPRTAKMRTCERCHKPMPPNTEVCPACRQPQPESPAPGVEQIKEPSQIAATKDAKTEGYTFKGCKILLVDQDKAMVQQLQRILMEKQFMVLTAANGEEALEQVARAKPHLIITEAALPKVDGLELIRRLRKNVTTTFIPVIIVSAKSETNDRIKGFAAGTDDYVTKPFSMHELFFRINAILRRTYK